jgi:DnaJ homolog subfamily C member 11
MADQAPPDDDASPAASVPSTSRYHLYAVLNVPRDASPGDIKRAYHSLSRVLHPDKQRRQSLNLGDDEYAARNREYQSVLHAWNVLGDPIQREIYDAFGTPGLKVFQEEMSSDDPSIFEVDENKGLTVYDTPQARLKQRVATALLENEAIAYDSRIKTNGAIRMDVDAVDALDPPPGFFADHRGQPIARGWTERPGLLDIAAIVVQQSVEAPLSHRDTLTIGGYAVTRLGTGYGDVNIALRRQLLPNTWAQVGLNCGQNRGITATMSRDLSEHDTLSMTGKAQPTEADWNFSLGVNWLRRLTDRSYILFGIEDPLQGNMTCSYSRSAASHAVESDIFLGPSGAGIGGSLKTKSKDGKTRRKVRGKLGAHGVELELTHGRTLSKRSDFSTALTFSLNGLKLELRLRRGFMRFNVPITLSNVSFFTKLVTNATATEGERESFWFDLYSSVGFMAVGALVEYVSAPRRKRARLKELKRRARHVSALRESALTQQRMMTKVAAEKTASQAAEGGLVILAAWYGSRAPPPEDIKIDEGNGDADHDAEDAGGGNGPVADDDWADDLGEQDSLPFHSTQASVDVAVPLAFFVTRHGTVSLPAGTKSGILGFCNPCILDGEVPRLFVQYAYQGVEYSAEFDDADYVELPSRSAVSRGPFRPLSREAQGVLDTRKRAAAARTRQRME